MKLEGSGDSFESLFKEEFKPPEDRTSSYSMKELSIEEIHSSGPLLRRLEKLEVDQLTLTQGYDHSWAMEMLSTYGPTGFPQSWDPDNWSFSVADYFTDELTLVKYLEEIFFSRALCGGFFLFALATGLEPFSCPGKESCRLVNQGILEGQIYRWNVMKSCVAQWRLRQEGSVSLKERMYWIWLEKFLCYMGTKDIMSMCYTPYLVVKKRLP